MQITHEARAELTRARRRAQAEQIAAGLIILASTHGPGTFGPGAGPACAYDDRAAGHLPDPDTIDQAWTSHSDTIRERLNACGWQVEAHHTQIEGQIGHWPLLTLARAESRGFYRAAPPVRPWAGARPGRPLRAALADARRRLIGTVERCRANGRPDRGPVLGARVVATLRAGHWHPAPLATPEEAQIIHSHNEGHAAVCALTDHLSRSGYGCDVEGWIWTGQADRTPAGVAYAWTTPAGAIEWIPSSAPPPPTLAALPAAHPAQPLAS